VVVDGKLLFSKHAEDRFPAYQEIPNGIVMAGLGELAAAH